MQLPAPPTKPDRRFSRIRLSSQHFAPTATNHTATPNEASRCCPPLIGPLSEVETSHVSQRLVVVVLLYRVHFRCGRSGSFRCSPPRLAATRLLQVLTSPTVAEVFHLGGVRSFAAHGNGRPARLETQAS